MKNHSFTRYRLSWMLVAALVINPVMAEKPSKDGGKHPHKEHHERRDDAGREHSYPDDDDRSRYDSRDEDFQRQHYFNDQHRGIMHDYYVQQYHTGQCPPGLAKKHNGCLPPGQAKKWRLGRPLPSDVVYYDVPAGILGYPPQGYRFVRVASDILMIDIGSGLVVDALTNLGAW